MPVLMLGGGRDEIVPRSQMRDLWAVIRKRGREHDAAAQSKKPPGGGVATTATAAAGGAEKAAEDENEPGAGPEPGNRKAPPRVIEEGSTKYIEFAAGMHSECPFFFFFVALLCLAC
jgi:hypothetical protein